MLAVDSVAYLLLIYAWRSRVFGPFNVVFQPHIITYDKRMPVAHAGNVKAKDDTFDLRLKKNKKKTRLLW